MPADNERIAVLEKAVEGFEKGVSRLESKLDSILDSIEKKFVPRHEYETALLHRDKQVEVLNGEIKSMKAMFWKILGGLIMAIITLGAAIIESVHLFK